MPAAMETVIRDFFANTTRYAVVGANNDPNRFGHKVFRWYLNHSLPVTPINIRGETILNVPSLKSIKDLPSPTETGLSIIVPPPATRQVLKDAAEIGIKNVFIQPGAWDDECLAFCKEKGINCAAGAQEEVGYEGACVLVHGEKGMADAKALGKL